MKNKGVAATPIIAIVFAILALGLASYLLVLTTKKETTVTFANYAISTNTPVNANGNTNVATTNANANANVNASEREGYSAPTGPFTLTNATTFAVPYRLANDRLITRLAKVNAATGKVVAEAQLNASDIPIGLGRDVTATSPSRAAIGADGDSVVLLSSSQSGPLYVGLYRTSFATPTKIERVFQYDSKNLFRGDVPTIRNFVFHAASNQVAFLIVGNEGKENNFLKVVNLADKTVKDVATFTTQPELVGFVSDGAAVQVFRKDDTQASEKPVGKGYLENIRVADGKVAKSTLVYDEAKLTPPVNVYQTSDGISPNLAVFAYNAYAENKSRMFFRNVSTGRLTTAAVEQAYGGTVSWSADSGKIFFNTNKGGVIYDLAQGVLATLEKGQSGFLWEPSALLVFSKQDGKLYSYNLKTKKEMAMPEDIAQYYGDGEYGYGYGASGIIGKGWVNR